MIGYIIGIIMGLYFRKSIVLFYITIIAMYIIIKKIYEIKEKKYSDKMIVKRKFKQFTLKRYKRYINLFINSKTIFILILASIFSNTIVIFQNNKYETTYKDGQIIDGEAIILSNAEENEYQYTYKIKYNKNILYLKLPKKSTDKLQYGDKINFSGVFQEPNTKRNYGGFDYKSYLKTLEIYGTIKCSKVQKLEEKKCNYILYWSNFISCKIKEKIENLLPDKQANILKAILLGDDTKLEKQLEEQFQISNISHVLAVSGMHVSYLIISIGWIAKSGFGKRKSKYILIVFLLFYNLISGFSPSIIRASLMGIIAIGANLAYRKNDIWNSIASSLLLLLIKNPFLIMNISLQFSYLGTVGVILLYSFFSKFLESKHSKNKKIEKSKNKMKSKIKDIVIITFSVQLVTLPITLYNFNMFGIYFIITNLLVGFLIAPILIIGVITVILSFIFFPLGKVVSVVVRILIDALIGISNFSKLPFAKIYFPTPSIFIIILYYLSLIFLYFIIPIYYENKKLNATQIRIRNLLALMKYQVIRRKKQVKIIFLAFTLIIVILNIIPNKLKIHFVDVGQGDCTLIETPYKQVVLIDGGGSSSEEFDTGKSILLPYILDRGYKKIDFIIISHCDQDHIRRNYIYIRRVKGKKYNNRKTI